MRDAEERSPTWCHLVVLSSRRVENGEVRHCCQPLKCQGAAEDPRPRHRTPTPERAQVRQLLLLRFSAFRRRLLIALRTPLEFM